MGAFPLELGISGPSKPGLRWPHYDSMYAADPTLSPHVSTTSVALGHRAMDVERASQGHRGLSARLSWDLRGATAKLSRPFQHNPRSCVYKQGPAEGAFPVSADHSPEVQHVSQEIKGGRTTRLLDWTAENTIPSWLASLLENGLGGQLLLQIL